MKKENPIKAHRRLSIVKEYAFLYATGSQSILVKRPLVALNQTLSAK
jgi:hypothetical protein